MSHTRGKFSMDVGSIDFNLFLGADKFADIGTHTAMAFTGPGLLTRTIAASNAAVLVGSIPSFLRTGELATPNNSQRQFGTAASQPGPSSVAGTSDPLAMMNFPPYTNALNPIFAPVAGAVPKGWRIRMVDVIYSVAAVALTALTIEVSATSFVNGVAPAVTDIVVLGQHGMSLATAAQPYNKQIVISPSAYVITPDTEIIVNINLTTPAGGTAVFYGVNIIGQVNYN